MRCSTRVTQASTPPSTPFTGEARGLALPTWTPLSLEVIAAVRGEGVAAVLRFGRL